jgi:predicted metal-dependent phosphotriesterase family hydrolase
VLTNIVPMMQDEGITDEQINIMLKENPADWLCAKE